MLAAKKKKKKETSNEFIGANEFVSLHSASFGSKPEINLS